MIWQFDHTKIRTAREIRGLTQEDLSSLTGMKVQYISFIETGRGTPNMGSLMKFCTALQCPPKFFFVTKRREAA